MLSVSLDCFCFVFLRSVYPMLSVSLDCFCFVFLRSVYPILPVSLDCPFLIAPSVFSNLIQLGEVIFMLHCLRLTKHLYNVLNIKS
jgi:hypothetical protein